MNAPTAKKNRAELDLTDLCECGHDLGSHKGKRACQATRTAAAGGEAQCACPSFRLASRPAAAAAAAASAALEATTHLRPSHASFVAAASSAAVKKQAAERAAASKPLLTEADYERAAHRILTGFEGVCSFAETRAVVAMRLREALELYIARKGGSAWATLMDLMCAYQKLQAVELAAREREGLPSSVSVSQAPKNGGAK